MPAKPRSNLLRDPRTVAAENQAASRSHPTYQGYLDDLVARGGPNPEEYWALDEWISRLFLALDRGEISQEVIESARREMSPVLAAPTMHGFACSKPHGYAGDFEIIAARTAGKIEHVELAASGGPDMPTQQAANRPCRRFLRQIVQIPNVVLGLGDSPSSVGKRLPRSMSHMTDAHFVLLNLEKDQIASNGHHSPPPRIRVAREPFR